MRKILILFAAILSFLNVSQVKADTVYPEQLKVNYNFNSQETGNYLALDKRVDEYIDLYNSQYASDYPYFIISLYSGQLYISMYKQKPIMSWERNNLGLDNETLTLIFENPDRGFKSECTVESCSDMVSSKDAFVNRNYFQLTHSFVGSGAFDYSPYMYYYSNFNMYIPKLPENTWVEAVGYKEILIQSLEDSSKYNVFNINSTGFELTPAYLNYPFDSSKVSDSDVINLNDYAYVALSLKDYTKKEELYTYFKVKGQLCLTSVYNYGTTERIEVMPGSQMQGCTEYYSDYTNTRVYITESDLKNHAIYYLKAYDKTKENLVSIDKSMFYITYIKEEDKDNPQVLIDGKLYPTIPFDKLTDTANKSEEEGYISGVSCPVGDLNCYNKYNPSNFFDSIFKSPLDFLKSIWSSITLVFVLINQFILLLPTTLQLFLYTSFCLAIILGLIKIIL